MNTNSDIGIITQVRMTSSRLPGKVLMKVSEKTLLGYHIDRLKQTGLKIIIATTSNEADDSIAEFAKENNLACFRGSEANVLSRFYHAALMYQLNTIIRVTSDCPLIDPHIIRSGLEKYIQLNNSNLYLSNTIERTYARGFDFEIFSFDALKDAFDHAVEPGDLEHVTPYIWKDKSGKTEMYQKQQDLDHSGFRITVDTKEDFELIKLLIEQHKAHSMAYNEIENLLVDNPELVRINAHVEQKKA